MKNSKFFQLFSKALLVLALGQVAFAYAGEPVYESTTVKVYNDGTPPELVSGKLTSNMVKAAERLIDFLNAGESSDYCDQETSQKGRCNISPSPNDDYPTSSEDSIWLDCTRYGNDELSCYLDISSETNPEPISPYSMECVNRANDGYGECTITTTKDAFADYFDDINPNLSGIAQGFLNSCLSSSYGPAADMCAAMVGALSAGNMSYATQLVQSLAPLDPETTTELGRDNLRNTGSVVSNRTAQIRSGNTQASNVQSQLFLTSNQWLAAGAKIAANDSLSSDVTPGTVSTNISDFGKLGFFINVNITDGKYKNGSLSSNNDFNSSMLTLGFDYRVRNDLVTGLAFNIGQNSTKFKSVTNGKLDGSHYSFVVYNSYYKDNWYFDTSLTLGGDDYKQTRSVSVPSNGKFEADYKAMLANLTAAFGYDFYIQSFSISPFAQISGGKLNIDGYKEVRKSGLGGVALDMDKQSQTMASFNLGARFRYIATTNHGVFIPTLSLTAVNDFKYDAQVVTGRFVGVADSQFNVAANKNDKDYFVIGAGFSFQLKNGNSGFVNLESLQGYSNLDQNRLTLGWRWEL